jgi:hypothetical protein
LEVVDKGANNGRELCGLRTTTIPSHLNSKTMFCGSQRGKSNMHVNSKKHWFCPYLVQYYLPNNMVLLVNVDNFNPNPLLIDVNKLKPYYPYDNNTSGVVLKFKGWKK